MTPSILFVNNDDQKSNFQALSNKWTCIEYPVWSLLLANGCRKRGFGVGILDCNAEQLSETDAITRIHDISPTLVCFVVYGQNPQAGIANMHGNISLAKKIKETHPNHKICFIGTYPSALPINTLNHACVDFVCTGDGFHPLINLLKNIHEHGIHEATENIHDIPGMGYKDEFGVHLSRFGDIVKNLDEELNDYAFDLIDHELYRSHVWHANFIDEYRQPSAAIYTSLGCSFKCNFCLINQINRDDHAAEKTAADFNTMRYWSCSTVLKWLEFLIEKNNITTIRFSDEMFFLNRKHFTDLLNGIVERGWGSKLKIWCYGRVDTINSKYLKLFNDAGINWLALGIESANQNIRTEMDKGGFQDTNIRNVVKNIKSHGINVMGNYMVGFPDDDWDTMQQTMNLAIELNTEYMNVYPTMPLPGSPLYQMAINNKTKLPENFNEWAFLGEKCNPSNTKYLNKNDVLNFRDYFWRTYVTNPRYLNLIKQKFGDTAVQNITEMSNIKLIRGLRTVPA